MKTKVKSRKILLSVLAIVLMIVLCGNVYSFATEGNTTNSIKITANTNSNTSTEEDEDEEDDDVVVSNNTIKANSSKSNTSNNVSNTNSANTSNSVTNNTSNNTSSNSSQYDNKNEVTNSSRLPHTGSGSKGILFVVIAVLSAVYAYKKVSDYNL